MKILIFISLLILTSLEAHADWFHQNSGTSANLRSVIFNHGNENIAWACGENGTILYTSNGGTNWIMQNSGRKIQSAFHPARKRLCKIVRATNQPDSLQCVVYLLSQFRS